MSTYTDASLIVTPNGKKAGKLYALKGADLDVVRATTDTYVGSDGLIKTAGINEPRFDYSNGSCPSILVEPQRTNLVFPSATATTQTRTVTAVAHTLSFYGTGNVVLSGVATGTLVGTGTSNKVTLTFTPTAGSLILTVTGNVTNWQLEAGSNATSYIPTTTTSVTRNADIISKSGISDLIGQTEGTLYWEGFLNLDNYQTFLLNVSAASGGNGTVHITKLSTNQIFVFYSAPSIGFLGLVSGPTITQDGLYKIACRYKSGNNAISVNGSINTNTTTYNFQGNPLILASIGTRGAFTETSFSPFRCTGSIIFKNTLSNIELQQLTTL